ncbi:MAG TPA: hypothetical protein ENH82_05525 [bacterium]|nr:hypothetical protein [bacterium]
MAIISFAKTGDEFLSGKKTVTRRNWTLRQYLMWKNFWLTGNLIHDAYDKLPRNGGKKIGQLQLTERPYRYLLKYMTAEDLIAEGGMCSTIKEFCELVGFTPEKQMTVIWFKKL